MKEGRGCSPGPPHRVQAECLVDPVKRSVQGIEVARAKRLYPCRVVPVERCDVGRAPRRLGRIRRTEPQSQVELVHRCELRVRRGIGERLVLVHHRGIETARGHRERLYAEAPHEVPVAFPLFVGLYVPLIPGDAEWRVGLLDDEQVELFILRHVAESNVHHLHRTEGVDGHVSVGLGVETVGGDCRAGTHHLEGGVVHCKGGRGEKGGHKQRPANSEHHALSRYVSAHFLNFLSSSEVCSCLRLIRRSLAPMLERPLDEAECVSPSAPPFPALGLPTATGRQYMGCRSWTHPLDRVSPRGIMHELLRTPSMRSSQNSFKANFYEKALFVKAAVAATVSECNGLRPSRYASIRTFGEPTLRWLGA